MSRVERERQAATVLVERAKGGDSGAFEVLVSRYRPRIFALALHLTGRESDADDVTQEVFLRAYRALDSFEGRSHFFSWLYRMAVNLSHNARRDRRRRAERPIDDPRIERALTVDAGRDPAQVAQLRQTYRRLLAALDRLPAPMRTSVVLVTLQGLSHAEVAVVQGCRPGTVAWHIHEARTRLRLALRPEDLRSACRGGRPGELSRELNELLRAWDLPVCAEAG
jgi:RNA polymerase sigma-70 factor (ECF subfamily)